MRRRRMAVAGVAGLLVAVALAGPALAGNGLYLKTGDVVCTDQARSDTGARFFATVTNGGGRAEIRTASTAGGPETVAWRSPKGVTAVDKTISAPAPGTYFRGLVILTHHTTSTWTKSFLDPIGAGSLGDIGPNTATVSPGGWSCGDSGMGPVRLTGSATGPVTWYTNAFDTDYAFVGSVFSVPGTASVDEVFTPGPDLSVLEMCVLNSGVSRVSASFELSPA